MKPSEQARVRGRLVERLSLNRTQTWYPGFAVRECFSTDFNLNRLHLWEVRHLPPDGNVTVRAWVAFVEEHIIQALQAQDVAVSPEWAM